MMPRKSLILVCALSLAAGATAAVAAEEPAIFYRNYQLDYLGLHAAEVLAWDQCPANAGDRCLVAETGVAENHRFIRIYADAATHERFARLLLTADAAPPTRTFQLILLVADYAERGVTDRLPDNAVAALADVRGFLPFSRYRAVDTAWMRTTRRAEATLTGPDGLPVTVELRFQDSGGGKLFVGGLKVDAPPVLAKKSGEAPLRPVGRTLINTSFGIDVGETLVVGTSKLNGGDEALVVLLTAVAEGEAGS